MVREFDVIANEELGLQFEYIMAPKGPVTLSFRDRVDATWESDSIDLRDYNRHEPIDRPDMKSKEKWRGRI